MIFSIRFCLGRLNIKWRADLLFSERNGFAPVLKVGPIAFVWRSYRRKMEGIDAARSSGRIPLGAIDFETGNDGKPFESFDDFIAAAIASEQPLSGRPFNRGSSADYIRPGIYLDGDKMKRFPPLLFSKKHFHRS